MAMAMSRFIDNAITVKIHEGGLIASVSSPLAPRLNECLVQAHPLPCYTIIISKFT